MDPAGALVVAGALAAGAREGHVALFGLVVLVGTVVLGTTLSLTVGPRIAEIDWSVFAPGDRTVAFVETLLGVGLVCWGVVRARRPTAHAPKPRSARGTGPIALVGAGILFALSAGLRPDLRRADGDRRKGRGLLVCGGRRPTMRATTGP